ncbi:uncharacterized protein [Montipora capricornis]|uniref:uncharacterized protein n=1 Tax=Montipora capricornis TaxID=246305 RepID=UPI0035F181D4
MTVYLFGNDWIPRCASFALLHVAWYQRKNFPEEVIRTASENVYTDDCLKIAFLGEFSKDEAQIRRRNRHIPNRSDADGFKETYSLKISTVEEWRQSAVNLSGFPLKDIDLIHIDWCDLLAEDEQEQEGQDNGESEHDEEQERADGVLLESDLEGEKEDEKHVGNKQAETDLDKKEEADVKDATVKAKEKLPGEMISQEPGAVGPKAVKTESSRVEKTRKCARSKVSFHSVWEVAGGGKSCQEKDPKAHRENAAQGASLLAVIEEEAGDLKLTSVLDSKEAKGAKTKNDEPKAAEVTEAGNVDVADELPVPTDADITNVTGVEEIDARKPEKEGPGDGDAIEVTNASGGAGLLMETAGGEMAGDAIPKWVDAAHLTSEEQEVKLMVSTTDGGTAGVHPIHADVADPREALNMQQEEDVEIVKVPSAGEAEKVKVPKAESQEKVQGAITGNAGATDAKDAKIKRKAEAKF